MSSQGPRFIPQRTIIKGLHVKFVELLGPGPGKLKPLKREKRFLFVSNKIGMNFLDNLRTISDSQCDIFHFPKTNPTSQIKYTPTQWYKE